MNKKGLCDLCGKKLVEGGTIIKLDEKHYLDFCEDCRRFVLVHLLEQYLLEADMQKFTNILTDEINKIRYDDLNKRISSNSQVVNKKEKVYNGRKHR